MITKILSKKKLLVGLVAVAGIIIGVITTLVVLQTDQGLLGPHYVFRKTIWDMTPEQVKAAERSLLPTYQSDSLVLFENVRGLVGEATKKVDIVYGFSQGKLIAACYGFNPQHLPIATREMLQSFHQLKDQLQQTYEEPMSSFERETESFNNQGANQVHTYEHTWGAQPAIIKLRLRERERWMKLPVSFDLCYLHPKRFEHVAL